LPDRAAASISPWASAGKARKAPTDPMTKKAPMRFSTAVKMEAIPERHDGAAHQGGRRHDPRAHQRQQREEQRHQHAETGGDQDGPQIDVDARAHRQEVGDEAPCRERQSHAQHDADRNTDRRQRRELEEIGGEHQPLRRTQALHRGDGTLARGEEARHRIADAHAADQQ
jgi:hypothetical protein